MPATSNNIFGMIAMSRNTMALVRPRYQPRSFLSTSRASLAETNPNPQRGAQEDREKMDTQANEYSKSGTDSSISDDAAQAAFDPKSSNDPEDAKDVAGKGNDVNPLEASPASPEMSSGSSEESSGAGKKEK